MWYVTIIVISSSFIKYIFLSENRIAIHWEYHFLIITSKILLTNKKWNINKNSGKIYIQFTHLSINFQNFAMKDSLSDNGIGFFQQTRTCRTLFPLQRSTTTTRTITKIKRSILYNTITKNPTDKILNRC